MGLFSERSTFRWPEAIVIVVLLLLGAFVFLPALKNVNEGGRRVSCKNNLAILGAALQQYHAQHGSYLPGVIYERYTSRFDGTIAVESAGFSQTANSLLLPYLEATAITNVRLRNRPWYEQPRAFRISTLSVFICPSNGNKTNPVDEPFMALVGQIAGGPQIDEWGPIDIYGLTDYLFCKGVTDAWCLTPGNVKPWSDLAHSDFTAVAHAERGMFDIAFPLEDGLAGGSFVCTPSMIADGASHTFMMGEGGQGPDFPITARGRLTTSSDHATLPHPQDASIIYPIYQAWMLPPNTSEGVARGLYLGSVFGCTLEPLNQSPVTHTVIETDPRDLMNCRPSLDWDGPAGPAPGGGVHRTSNFRSAHKGGGHFLYADASVQFIDDDIDLGTYRAMSTIAGEEKVETQD